MSHPKKLFSFATRDDVLHELAQGRDAKYVVAFECPKCSRLHVVNYVPRLTPFSSLDHVDLPNSVPMTIEQGRASSPVSTKSCPADGTQMIALRNEANGWLFSRRGEKSEKKLFSFATRDEVLQEILHGRDARYLVGFACPRCQRLHVTSYAVRLTAFSNLDNIDLPAGVRMTADEGDDDSPVSPKRAPLTEHQ